MVDGLCVNTGNEKLSDRTSGLNGSCSVSRKSTSKRQRTNMPVTSTPFSSALNYASPNVTKNDSSRNTRLSIAKCT